MAENASNTSCGWNRPSAALKPPPKKPGALKGALAGVLIVAALGAVCWMMFSGDDAARPSREKGSKTIKTARPTKAAKAPDAVATNAVARVAKPKTVEDVLQNIDAQPKPLIKKRELTPEDWDRLTNRTFHTGTEQMMSWVFSTMPGDPPMPIPPLSNDERADLVAVLISKNEITDKDDERTAFCKQQVDSAKKEMMKYIKDGGDPDDFLQFYYRELEQAHQLRMEALDQIRETVEEDPELANQLREAVNKKFEEKGIREICKEEIE